MQIDWNERFGTLSGAAEPNFHNVVISDTHYPMWGVRIPTLRTLAKELSKGDWEALTCCECYGSFEQVLVTALAVAYARCPFTQKETAMWRILPALDSWAMTDTVVPTLKPRREDIEPLRSFALACLKSEREYTVRFGVIVLMDYFLSPEELPWTLDRLSCVRDERYYVRMALAWCYAEIAVREPECVLRLLENGCLDVFVHNKTIQKMRESYRIRADVKDAALRLKRKEGKA